MVKDIHKNAVAAMPKQKANRIVWVLIRCLFVGIVMLAPLLYEKDARLLAELMVGYKNNTSIYYDTKEAGLSAILASRIANSGTETSRLSTTDYPNALKNKAHSVALTDVTRSYRKIANCSYPYVPIYDRIVEDPYDGGKRKIPRQIHVAWITDEKNKKPSRDSRCLHYQQAKGLDRWKEALPNYSIYFHDNYAVDTLMDQDNWPEFPNLKHILKCVQMKSAMLIDIWRHLVLYQYGGIYVDMDVQPGPKFSEETIPADVDFFSLSDSWSRPSQWLFGESPGHPVAYFSMLEILQRVHALGDISRPKLVFTTGPEALKHGYGRAFFWKKDEIFGDGVFQGVCNSTARKIGHEHYTSYVFQNINEKTVVNGTEMTIRDQLKLEAGQLHWLEEAGHLPEKIPAISCVDYLFTLEREANYYPNANTNSSNVQ